MPHSEHGSQDARDEYQAWLKPHGITVAMNRKVSGRDTTRVERFFCGLKRECIGNRLYRGRQEAMGDVREYVAAIYNAM